MLLLDVPFVRLIMQLLG